MPPNYKCERCQRSFTTKSGLGVHKANSTLCEYTDWIVDQYKRGYSAREIAEMMDVDAAHQSIRRIVDDLEVKRSKSEANEMAWDKGFFDAPDPDLEITEDLAWLVGVLLGDGSVYKAASKEYVIALGVIDKPFADEFARVLESIGLTASRYYDEDHHPNPVHQVRACSKKFYEWWQNRPVAKIASKHPAAFIRGIYDSEGSLRSRGPNSWSISISMQDGWILRSVRASTPMPHFSEWNGVYWQEEGVGSEPLGRLQMDKTPYVKGFINWIEPTIPRKDYRNYELVADGNGGHNWEYKGKA